MKHTLASATANTGGDFNPRQAAALFDHTTVAARRQFEPNPPWLLVTRAVLALVAYGALWLSVRGQHPYAHPTAAVIPVGVGVGIANVIATITLAKRAAAGISGRRRLRPAEIAIMAAVWSAVFVAIWPMAVAGVSDRIVYGLYPATAPLIIAGLAWAAMMAARADWRACGSGLAAAALGAVAWLAGPAGAWAVVGIGIAVLLLVHAAEISRRHRA
jgi:hypothetical protein